MAMESDVRSRFRIRNVLNNGWLDAATTEVMIRDPDNLAWIRLEPENFSIRDQTNSTWIDIDNAPELDIEDPCLYKSDPTSCDGLPTDTAFGSGTGDGSGGALYSQDTGYPSGYDMPDAGYSGFGVEHSGVWPSGFSIRRPALSKSESYDNTPIAADNGDAIFVNPALANTSVFGRGAEVTEFYYLLGSNTGNVDVLWASYGEDMSVDVYYLGKRVATSCGKQSGRGRLSFIYNPTIGNGEERIMVRVRTSTNSKWAVQVLAPSVRQSSDTQDLALDYYKTYNVQGMPDILSADYIGTPVFPAPCHASVYVNKKRLSTAGHFEYYHHVGSVVGWMYLDYKSWENADFVEVYHFGHRIATTLDPEMGRGFLYFYFDPTANGCEDIMIRVVSANKGSDSTTVYYALWCPDTAGSREQRHPCGTYEVFSAGHPTTEDCFTLTGYTNDLCGALITVDSGSFSATFSAFDENDKLLDSVTVQGQSTLEFWLPVGQSYKRKIYVQVSSAIGSDWSYYVSCPKQKPVIQVPDYYEQYICEVPTDINSATFDWTRVAHSDAGVDSFDYNWEYGFEYAFVCSYTDPVFSTWQLDKLLSWSASRKGTAISTGGATELFPVLNRLADQATYHPLWITADDKNPYGYGATTIVTDWKFYCSKAGNHTIKFAGDDNVRFELYESTAGGSQGELVISKSMSGGSNRSTLTVDLTVGWYFVHATAYNKDDDGYSNNPGYVGVRIDRTGDVARQMATAVTAMFEEVFTPLGSHVTEVGEAQVAMTKMRGNLKGKVGVAATNREWKLHSVYRRRVKLSTSPSLKSNTWERVVGSDLRERSLAAMLSSGYEYWAITDSNMFFSTHHFHLLKKWATSSAWGPYTKTYATTTLCPSGLWASATGNDNDVECVNETYCLAIYEVVAPVTGAYTIQAWGNDDPMFGIYAGPYTDDGAFQYKTGDWAGYTKLWYWYRNDDDNATTATINLAAGERYTIRVLCRNDNGGDRHMGVRITLPKTHVLYANAGYGYGRVHASHFIIPDPDNAEFVLDAVIRDKAGWTGLTVSDDMVSAVDGYGVQQLPALTALYRRPLFRSSGDSDRGGWRVDYVGPLSGAPSSVALAKEANRDYFFYVKTFGHDVPLLNPDAAGAPLSDGSAVVFPLRFLNAAVAYSQAVAPRSVVAARSTREVQLADTMKSSSGIVWVVSRPCYVKT